MTRDKIPLGIIFGRRSGTSSMARELFKLGYPLRGPLDCRPFPGSQPEGHYETFRAREMNGQIMKWFTMQPATPGLTPFLIYPHIQKWVSQRKEPFVFKDPNTDLCWPIWVRSLPYRQLIGLWCRRDKVEQRDSLIKRYRMDLDAAHWCVEMYEICIQAACQHMPMREVQLEDPDRVEKAVSWFRSNGISVASRHPEDIEVFALEEDQQSDLADGNGKAVQEAECQRP